MFSGHSIIWVMKSTLWHVNEVLIFIYYTDQCAACDSYYHHARYSWGRIWAGGERRREIVDCSCVAGKWRMCNQVWSVEIWDGNSSGKLGRYITDFHNTLTAKCVDEFSSKSPGAHLALEHCNISQVSKHTHIPHQSVLPSHQLIPLLIQLEEGCSYTKISRNHTEGAWRRVGTEYSITTSVFGT